MDKYRSYLAVGIVAAVFMSSFFWGVPTSCFRLPNGLNIGKQALIDLSRPYSGRTLFPNLTTESRCC